MASRPLTKLTDKAVANLKPRPTRYQAFDEGCPGLSIRVTPTGGKSWVWQYREHVATTSGGYEPGKRQRFWTLGTYPALSLRDAHALTEKARSLLKKPSGVSFVQVNLFEKDRAPQNSLQIQDVLKHSAKPWQEREKSWLSTFRALRISSAITVSVFTLIAGLAMFNTLAMIVLEKTKDIAILRSMGYERRDITQIFLWQAGIVLAIGAFLGCVVGALSTLGVSYMPLPISGIFKTETFVVSWNIWHYVQAIATAALMVMIASLIPARRAARLEPGDIVRGTAQ